MEQFMLQTPPEGFIDITRKVAEIVHRSQVRQGICQVFVPHTTAGVTINENADPDVVHDLLAALNTMAPALRYRHGEGNSPAHLKSLLTGSSVRYRIYSALGLNTGEVARIILFCSVTFFLGLLAIRNIDLGDCPGNGEAWLKAISSLHRKM